MNFTDPSLYGSTLPQREFPFPTPPIGAQFAPWQVPTMNLPWQGLTPPWQGFQRMVPPTFQFGFPAIAGYVPQELGYTPHGMGYLPQVFGYTPRNFGYTPQNYNYMPQNYGFTPRNFEYTPQNYGFTPRNFEYTPQNYGFTPRSFDYTPQNYGFMPRNFDYTPQNYGCATQNFTTPVGMTAGMAATPWNAPYDTTPYNRARTH